MKFIKLTLLMYILLSLVEVCLGTETTRGTNSMDFTRRRDVIYGRKHGMAGQTVRTTWY